MRTEPNFPKEERETALKQLGMVATALAEMSNIFTDDVKRSAFEQIVSSADIDLGAATLGETFAPVLAQVEAAGIFTETDKRRLRLIVTGSQAQDTLAETMTDENGKTIPVWPEDNPLQVRPGVSMYADGNQRQYLKAECNGHITEIDTTGWRGETVGKYLEALSFVHGMESFGGTGILQSVYKIDFNLFGDEGFGMAKIDQILNIMGKLFGGLEHADGDIARAGQRQGYIRFLVRLLNKRGTAMGHEESQADTNEVIHELQLHNPDGSPNCGLAANIRADLVRDIGPYITPSIGFGANQVLAKIAAEMEKPNGLMCLHPRDMPGALYKIKLNDIPGIGRRMKARLKDAGIVSVEQLMGLSGKQMRGLWRSVEGERLWAGLHGYQLEKPETERRMFGHGRILSPDWRNRAGARNCARLLLVKAARRLRWQNFAASTVAVSVGFNDKTRRSLQHRLPVPAIDDQTFLAAFEVMFARLWETAPPRTPFKVSVCLFGLVASNERAEDLLEDKSTCTRRHRWEKISGLVDGLNTQYARTMVSHGTHIEPPGGYAGGKIAFGRIPDMEDFL